MIGKYDIGTVIVIDVDFEMNKTSLKERSLIVKKASSVRVFHNYFC